MALLVQLGTKAPLRRTGYMAIRAGWHQLSNKLTSSHDTKVNPLLLHLFPSIIPILYSAAGRSLDDGSISRRHFARNFLVGRFDDRYSKSFVYHSRHVRIISWKIVEDKILKESGFIERL